MGTSNRTLAGLIEEAKKFMAEAEQLDLSDNQNNAPDWVKNGSTLVNIKIEHTDFIHRYDAESMHIPWSLFFVNKYWYEEDLNASKIGLAFPNCLVVAPTQPYFNGRLIEEPTERLRVLNKYFYQIIPIKYFKSNNSVFSWDRKYNIVPIGMSFVISAGPSFGMQVPVRDYILFGSIVNMQSLNMYNPTRNIVNTVRAVPHETNNTIKNLVGAITEDLLEFSAPFSA